MSRLRRFSPRPRSSFRHRSGTGSFELIVIQPTPLPAFTPPGQLSDRQHKKTGGKHNGVRCPVRLKSHATLTAGLDQPLKSGTAD